jgi:tetratricopeptide (TPR) repeat protein
MYRRDYLLRLMEQMNEAAGTMLGLKRQGKPLEALQTAEEMWKRLLGMNAKLFHSLPEEEIVSLLTHQGIVQTEKLLIAARLLKEEGDAYETLGENEPAYRRRLKALQLMLAADHYGAGTEWIDYPAELDDVLANLRGYRLPPGTLRRLWHYLEQRGRYAAAEDRLYELLEAEPEAAGEGVKFYERLLGLEDSRLEAGNLPREEVLDGMRLLQSRLETADRRQP